MIGLGLFLGHRLITDNLQMLFDSYQREGANILSHAFSSSECLIHNADLVGQLSPRQREKNLAPLNTELGRNYLRVQLMSQDESGTNLIYSNHFGPMLENIPGYHRYSQNGEDWQSYALYDEKKQIWTVVADKLKNRRTIINSIFIQLVLFLSIGFISLTQVISFAIYYGFKPIKKFARALREKKEDDLSPLQLNRIPQELVPLVSSSNDLLCRLKNAFEREAQFSADVAHELRNPLAGIRINLENFLEEIPNTSESAIPLQQGISRMQNIVEQMLVLHRIAPDTFMANFDEIDLCDAVNSVLRQLNSSIEDKQHRVSVSCHQSSMKGERYTLEILIRNLLVNSIKYCPPGSRIHIGIYYQEENNVVLEIQDSGPGIPEHERVHIFRRFYRAGGDCHASGIEGCGLGLSIVEKIVKLHQSVISIGDSIFSSGLSVKVVFPKHL